MSKAALILFIITITVYVIGWNSPYRSRMPGYHSIVYTPAKYRMVQQQVQQMLAVSDTNMADSDIVGAFNINLQKAVTVELLPYWLGTPWAFHGTTRTPGKGSIACGYFVTTMLEHCGAHIDRNALAKCASEQMIRSLVSASSIEHFNRLDYSDFIAHLKNYGTALYIIGLDKHTGFLEVSDDVYFIHSSGRFPRCVIREKALTSAVLLASKYKVTGRLTNDIHFLQKFYQTN